MAKGTMLDRLTEAMKTLGKREGKALTPKQRWNDQRWMKVERRGANGWEQLDPDERIVIRKDWPETDYHITSGYAYPGSHFIEETKWVPVQGPDRPMQDSEVYESIDEFPDDFDYMWRY